MKRKPRRKPEQGPNPFDMELEIARQGIVRRMRKPKNSRESSWRRQGIDITVAEYDALLEKQGNVCALCYKSSMLRRLDVDHDHRTGRVRGLLCRHCNRNLRVCRWVTHAWLDKARAYCGLPERLV